MEIFQTIAGLPESAKGGVVAIGNFDGVHRGHQDLLVHARALASEQECPFIVLTFEPHPRTFFRPDSAPFRITSPDVKHWRLEESGVETCVSLHFDAALANQSAEDFIRTVLQEGLRARHIVVGSDFHFGKGRAGSPDTLRQAGLKVSEVEKEGLPYSSTAVRDALAQGDMAEATRILGWDWEIRGIVVKGDQRGRTLGFPTANIALADVIHPAYGVYAGRVQVEGENMWHMAALNIGVRPMYALARAQVEAFLIDFSGDLYGKILRVQPTAFLRGEEIFDSEADLVAQMEKDCAVVHVILSEAKNLPAQTIQDKILHVVQDDKMQGTS